MCARVAVRLHSFRQTKSEACHGSASTQTLSCLLAENRKLLHAHDVETALVGLLSAEGDGVRTAACHAVATMSIHLVSKDTFRELG